MTLAASPYGAFAPRVIVLFGRPVLEIALAHRLVELIVSELKAMVATDVDGASGSFVQCFLDRFGLRRLIDEIPCRL